VQSPLLELRNIKNVIVGSYNLYLRRNHRGKELNVFELVELEKILKPTSRNELGLIL
jgi:hypothetical protein